MYSHMGKRYSTVSLLLDRIIFLYARLRRQSLHRAKDISYLVTLSGNPPGF